MSSAYTEWHVRELAVRKEKARYWLHLLFFEDVYEASLEDLRAGIKQSVYFVQERKVDGLVKIGTSTNVQKRVRALRAGELDVLAIVDGGYRVEALIHRAFKAARVRGEWFRPVPSLLAYIDALNGKNKRSIEDLGEMILGWRP